jgi:hypothetical protein
MAQIAVTIGADTTELEADMERIENGDPSTPTVSAVRIVIDGKHVDYFPQ